MTTAYLNRECRSIEAVRDEIAVALEHARDCCRAAERVMETADDPYEADAARRTFDHWDDERARLRERYEALSEEIARRYEP